MKRVSFFFLCLDKTKQALSNTEKNRFSVCTERTKTVEKISYIVKVSKKQFGGPLDCEKIVKIERMEQVYE